MAESDSILQLGIEAARDGNREEARNLFRLLTRQDPSNAQAWLWLAGVAENRDERQVALEHVVDLDPDNEMAVKGLLALGVRPQVRTREEYSAPTMAAGSVEPQPEAVVAPVIPEAAAERSRYDIDDDDPYADLDNLSDVMAEAPAAVRRTDPEPSDIDSLDEGLNADPGGPSRRSRTRDTTRGNRYSPLDDDEETVPARRGISPWLLRIVIVALVLLLALLAWSWLRGRGTSTTASTSATQTAIAQEGGAGIGNNATTAADDATAVAGGVASGDATAVAGGVAATDPTAVAGGATAAAGAAAASDATAVAGGAPVPAGEATAVPPQPATSPPQPATDVSGAAPALVAPNTPLESNGWLYDFNQPTYAAPIIGGLGNTQPQGRFVVVLAFLANRTGAAQPVPADFFVLKDAQGRVYNASPAASSAYVQRGINADLSLEDAVPADGLTRSVALIFDVQPDATNLVFFARSKTDQGWQVLSSVQ